MTVPPRTGRAPIPFHRPSITDGEREAMLEVLASGWLTTGERVLEFERAVEASVGSRHAVAVNSATAALHLALEALGIGGDDEVVVPTYTFAACGEVVRYLGARPRLTDVDGRTMNITAETLEAAIRPNTKAAIVVHFGGLLADMAPILELAARTGIAIIEDAAHAIPASRLGRAAGSFGDVGALSFYATKTVTTGEGGMLLTNSDRIAARARVTRLHGITGDVWKRHTSAGSWYYEIEDIGYKYNLTDLAAALGIVQLRRAESMRLERQRVAERYTARFADLLGSEIELPEMPDQSTVHAWHLYPIRIRDGGLERRAAIIDELRKAEIGTSVHFIPLHLHPYYGRTYGYGPGDFPVAEAQYEREISLPIYPDLSDSEVDRVIEATRDALRTVPATS